MKINRQIQLFALSLMTALLPYCKGSSQTASGSTNGAPAMASTSQYIDARMGGTITLGNQMTLSIPADSLDESTEISVSQVVPPAPRDGVNPLVAYSFNQHGLQFHIPATLKICYPGSAVSTQNLNEDSTAIYHDDDSNYASYAGLIDKTHHCVQTEINHFSTYFVAAQSLLSVNAAPVIGGATFMPAIPVAGIPLKIRSVVTDFNATGRGQVASVWLHYCVGNATVCTTPANFTKVAMTLDTTSTVTTNRYAYTLPANVVTTAGIRYFIESIDNLRATRVSPTVYRAITATATGLTIIPATLDIAAGFSRQYNVRVTATAGAAQDIDFAPLTVGNAVGTTALNNQGVWLFSATTSGDPLTTGFRTGSVIATLGALSASAPVKVWPGQLAAIQLLDSFGVVLGSNITLAPNAVFDFDARGLDAFGNFSLVYPAWIVTNPLVGAIPGNNGLFNASANDGQSGQVLAVVDNIVGSITVNIVAPPTVTLSLAGSPFSENGGVATVTANLSQAYGSATTVNLAFSGSAPNTDYIASAANIFIPAGQTSGSMTLTGVDNAVFDGSRTVIVDIASVVNGTEAGVEQVTATIQDDETAPFPIAATPLDGSTNNPVTTSVSVTFNQPMNPATLTTTGCTGSLQLSADDFVTCVAMNASLGVMSNGNATVTFTPATALANNTLYKIRVTTAAQGANGAPVATTITSPSGWTTEVGAPVFAGQLDPTFGGSPNPGMLIPRFAEGIPGGLVIDATGNILVTGGLRGSDGLMHAVVMKIDANGALVSSFGNNGIYADPSSIETSGADIVLDSNGNILVVGETYGFTTVWRILPNGTLDTSFGSGGSFGIGGSGGFAASPNYSLVLDAAGSILVAGVQSWQGVVFKVTPNGFLDTTFGNFGVATLPGSDNTGFARIRLNAAGEIIVGGRLTTAIGALWKLTPDGNLDNSFGSSGLFLYGSPSDTSRCFDVLIEPTGRILMTGITFPANSPNYGWVVAVTSGGAQDITYANAGVATLPSYTEARGLFLDNIGRLMVIGSHNSGAVWRLTGQGVLDLTYGNGTGEASATSTPPTNLRRGVVDSQGNSITLGHAFVSNQPNGQIFAAPVLARFR